KRNPPNLGWRVTPSAWGRGGMVGGTGQAALPRICVRKSEISLDSSANQNYLGPIPCRQEGTYRDRHGTLAREAMDAAASGARERARRNAAAYGEVVWS